MSRARSLILCLVLALACSLVVATPASAAFFGFLGGSAADDAVETGPHGLDWSSVLTFFGWNGQMANKCQVDIDPDGTPTGTCTSKPAGEPASAWGDWGGSLTGGESGS